MGNPRGFLDVKRSKTRERPAQERVADYHEFTVEPTEAELRALVEEHAQVTGSARAKRILATWDVQLSKFVKVMPRDYKRALAELAAENAVA